MAQQMALISSEVTILFKYLFPTVFFGGAGATLLATQSLMPAILMAAGGLVFTWFFTLADQVLDGGDHLIIRRGSTSQRVALSDIRKVDVSLLTSPPIVTLHMKVTQAKSQTVKFIPRASGIYEPDGRGTGQDLEIRVRDAQKRAV